MSSLRLPPLARFATAAALLFAASAAHAATVSFTDSVRYWSGWANGTADDGRDTIGTPNFTGGTATFDDATGRLVQVALPYTGQFSPVASGNARVLPGDLFLDAGADGDWDYVMKLVAGAQTPVASYASLSILDVGGVAAPTYWMSGSDNTGYWRGYGVRDRHPYAWSGGGAQIGTGSLGSFDQLASGGTIVLNLGDGLWIGDQVRIGFAPSCANDVVLATVAAPVPEPTAVLLFGVGLAAVAKGSRRARR
ncbi:MAG: hypothetical protein DCC71_07940 [Proteobacteria bacterium]|nr:MAG: hypothetical protein DCC71_07940 [Pseudomonadota bacterium]